MARFVFMILDGVGVGALPDADAYGDTGSDTLGNLSRVVDLHLPFFERLGLGNIAPIIGVPPVNHPLALPGRLRPLSAGKDTTVGHWEHMGLVTATPFPTYPQGFPQEIIGPFQERIGRRVLGNKPASGTAIIAELGNSHLTTGAPIVYTSADSVFQIAAHVDVVPLELLYEWCRIARELLHGEHGVGRVIARPFSGPSGHFVRTADRRDLSLPPPGPTYLDLLFEASIPVLALGKIGQVFTDRGITTKIKVADNADNLATVLNLLRGTHDEIHFEAGLLFTNLVDFDMIWGHRNDVEGFAEGLRTVDAALPAIVGALLPEDRLVISADHGVDPTTPSTDHSREYVPLLLYPHPSGTPDRLRGGPEGAASDTVYEGSLADTGATIYDYLAGEPGPAGSRPRLAGSSIYRLHPTQDLRRPTPARPALAGHGLALPGRVGPAEAQEAARLLRARLGEAPPVALILGSGQSLPVLPTVSPTGPTSEPPTRPTTLLLSEPVPYKDIPHWRSGTVPGHAQGLVMAQWALPGSGDNRIVLLRGRVHSYEGFDLSELELPVRTLAAWGVRRLIVTSAAGAVSTRLKVGEMILASEIIDLQDLSPGAAPMRIPATDAGLLSTPARPMPGSSGMTAGMHAAVPGPQYETPTELAVLRALGAATVSMSGAAEIRAAREEGLGTAMIAIVTNVGETSHDEVLSATAGAGGALAEAVGALLLAWGPAVASDP